MFERILLAVDRSDYSKRAVELVTELAPRFGAEVIVFHVKEREVTRGGSFDLETREEAGDVVDAVVRELKDLGIACRGEVLGALYGRVANEILEMARAEGADVIVLGSRGLSDWSGLLLGSVTHKVLHLADIPVVVAR